MSRSISTGMNSKGHSSNLLSGLQAYKTHGNPTSLNLRKEKSFTRQISKSKATWATRRPSRQPLCPNLHRAVGHLFYLTSRSQRTNFLLMFKNNAAPCFTRHRKLSSKQSKCRRQVRTRCTPISTTRKTPTFQRRWLIISTCWKKSQRLWTSSCKRLKNQTSSSQIKSTRLNSEKSCWSLR